MTVTLFRELFHYLEKPIYFCTLDIFQIVVPVETFLSCGMTHPVKKLSQVRFSLLVENLLPGRISEVTFLFWQQMAVFPGTIALF